MERREWGSFGYICKNVVKNETKGVLKSEVKQVLIYEAGASNIWGRLLAHSNGDMNFVMVFESADEGLHS